MTAIWILILTVTTYDGGVFIETIPTFPTENECVKAGTKWRGNKERRDFVCVRTSVSNK